MVRQKGLFTNILQNILFCVLQKKESLRSEDMEQQPFEGLHDV